MCQQYTKLEGMEKMYLALSTAWYPEPNPQVGLRRGRPEAYLELCWCA